MQLTGIFIYPVKGCRGLSLSECAIDKLGLEGDRRFMVTDPEGNFLTQRSDPSMALIDTHLDADRLTLSASGIVALHVPRRKSGAPLIRVNVWKSSQLEAEDCGDEAATWVATVLGRPARLVRAGAAFHRPVLKTTARPGDIVSFSDAYPFLAISEASLADLNQRFDRPFPMDRFRPNLVISGCQPFAEDTWPYLKIGEIVFRAGGPCARCIVTTTDQRTGARGKEPLQTLAVYRRDPYNPQNVNFGQNFLHETKAGSIRLSDPVSCMEFFP